MTIKTGDAFPDVKIMLATPSGPKETTTRELLDGKKTVLFAVPGAFTPLCSEQHLPGYVANAGAFLDKGVDQVVCLSVNDMFVMGAWAKQSGAEGKIVMLADGSGTLTRALGLELDLVGRGLGMRAQRFAMVLDGMTVTYLGVEPPGGFAVSAAEQVLEQV
jgi:peroxiredoxin (alkyl hydroperoxide reductase subunit C)